jgi:hypothetical protein
MQNVGLEWLYRMGQEPGRLGGRYVVTGAQFAARLLPALVRARLGALGCALRRPRPPRPDDLPRAAVTDSSAP